MNLLTAEISARFDSKYKIAKIEQKKIDFVVGQKIGKQGEVIMELS